jgi:hypothetical protein
MKNPKEAEMEKKRGTLRRRETEARGGLRHSNPTMLSSQNRDTNNSAIR